MAKPEEEEIVRINVLLPLKERDAFDLSCRHKPGQIRTSMSWRIRELLAADAAGDTVMPPRRKPPKRGGVPYSKAAAAPPAPAKGKGREKK